MSTKLALDRLYERASGICHWCGRWIPRWQATRDHVVPRAQGGIGLHNNVVMACASCNNDRTNIEADEHDRRLERRRIHAFQEWAREALAR